MQAEFQVSIPLDRIGILGALHDWRVKPRSQPVIPSAGFNENLI